MTYIFFDEFLKNKVYLNTNGIYCFKTKIFLKLIFSSEILIDIDFSHPPFLCAECKFRTVGLEKIVAMEKTKSLQCLQSLFLVFEILDSRIIFK